ncbi:hypothetical protein ORV05_19245 [Amycolatopsis cynarae]|uniref:Exo-alpha-sialidase n=1 Tax=Amycolatopsis cynarae TaxID=2995223 RepID=A0ABY7AUH1_9PSEU|nr:hypothetical protein [Amycolatopsis sp. HUAS 11-8]WAL63168.1 hypothetical protein ORV05_19245 [Amycolatopsis sp. HUAS 11-8]
MSADWRELPLPAPDARVLAMAPLAAGVLVLGSVPGSEGRAPAAWTTADGRYWRPVPVAPHSAYAFQAELASVGVAGDRWTVLGQAFGGAHGSPRMTVWSGGDAGLAEHPQAFELFGGPHAVAVTSAAALPGTGLLVGQWENAIGRSGAAVWTSADGTRWQRNADDPALSSAPGEQTSAVQAAPGPLGFLMAGYDEREGLLTPLAWASPDGQAWRRLPVPPPGASSMAQRVACDGQGCVLGGATAGARSRALCWPVDPHGVIGAGQPGPESKLVEFSQLLLRDTRVFAVLRVDDRARLAVLGRDCTGWQDLPLPVGAAEACLAPLPGEVLLATTDPEGSRLWVRADDRRG